MLDRELIFIVCFGIMGIALFGGFYLGSPTTTDTQVSWRPDYAPEDIRYKFQQEEKKEAAKQKGKHQTQPAPSAPTSSGSEGSDESSDSGDTSTEEPSAEEPPIE